MFCPKCGQEKLSPDTNFCSRCGFLLTGTLELLQSGGNAPIAIKTTSPRTRGLKQGLFIFLLTFLVVPIVAILTVAANAEPFAVAICAIALFFGGLLRMVYAMMFEDAGPKAASSDDFLAAAKVHLKRGSPAVLPPQRDVPASELVPPRAGHWRDTNDLQPASVTENTTKLLEKDDTGQ
jgi:hypothetical protein